MLHSLALELYKKPIRKNWLSKFINRHYNRLAVSYLNVIKHTKRKVDLEASYKRFFN